MHSDGSKIPGATMYDYGFNHEGFVTGGMNHLESMIRSLKSRGIKVIINLHAVPGAGSNCQSYSGIQLSDVNQSFWYGSPPQNYSIPISGV